MEKQDEEAFGNPPHVLRVHIGKEGSRVITYLTELFFLPTTPRVAD